MLAVYVVLGLIAAGWTYVAVDAAGFWGAVAVVVVAAAIIAAVATH